MEIKDRLLPLNLQFFAEGGEGGEVATAGENGAESTPAETNPEPAGENADESTESLKAKIAQLEQNYAKEKAAKDKAMSEASTAKKALKARMTQEEIDAASKQEEQEKAAAHVAELEKKVARIETAKSVMGNLGVNEVTAGEIAESLIGCENVENALLLIRQAWDAKEKALRAEFGKIPPPGAGGGSEDREKQAAMAFAKEYGQQRAGNKQSVRDKLSGLIR